MSKKKIILKKTEKTKESKVIIITGMQRSGTTLAMRLMFYLDVPICGRPFPINRNKLYNVDGYYEDPDIYSGNIDEVYNDEYYAVKIHLRKLVEKLLKPNKLSAATHKIILCTRNYADLTTSQMASEASPSSTYARSLAQNQRWYQEFFVNIGDIPYLTLNLETLKVNKSQEVSALKTFVGAPRADETTAIGIIK